MQPWRLPVSSPRPGHRAPADLRAALRSHRPADPPLVDAVGDPLAFVDTRPRSAADPGGREATGLDEAVVCVRGTVEGQPLIAAVMDFRFLGGASARASASGSPGRPSRARVPYAAADRQRLRRCPDAGGGRRDAHGHQRRRWGLHQAGVLTISLVSDPTYGWRRGIVRDALRRDSRRVGRLRLRRARVIQQTLRQPLPAGFQTAEYLFALRHAPWPPSRSICGRPSAGCWPSRG